MAADYELVLFAGLASIGLVMLLGGLATPRAREYLDRKPGLSRRLVALAMLAGVALPVGLTAVGEFPGSRGAVRAVGVEMVLFAAGLLGVASGLGNAAVYRRFRSSGDVPTGEVATGPVAVTGVVKPRASGDATDEDANPPTSPFFGAPAVAWSWTVAAKDRHGTGATGRRAWSVARRGRGGVTFALDDGSGPVRVDPTGARLDLGGETVEERDPGDPPGRAAEVADLDIGGDRFRFREAVLSPGATATVFGVAGRDDGGPTVAVAGDAPFVITEGGRSTALRNHAVRAAGYGVGGLLAAWLGLRWLAGAFGVPFPV